MATRERRGFTLIELMVVLVILGALVALVVPNVVGTDRDATRRTAVIQMASLAEAVEIYAVRNRRLPQTLSTLAEREAETGEPYLRRVPEDPWGNPYEYRVLGAREFEIRSAGEDGQAGTEDDLLWPQGE